MDSDAEIVVDDVDTEESGGSELRKVPAATHLPRCTTATYHCVYCNHTFKSHYCYQVSHANNRLRMFYENRVVDKISGFLCYNYL